MQLRYGASLSPLDFFRGSRVLDLSRADCKAHDVEIEGRRVVEPPIEAVLVTAYRAKADALDAARAQQEVLLARAESRLRANVITVMEYRDVQRLVSRLSESYEEASNTVRRLRAEGIEAPPRGLQALAGRYTEVAMEYEDRAAKLRALDPWSMRVIGGVIPNPGGNSDWYGLLEVSYNLGGLFRVRQEKRYLEARREEIQAQDYELPKRVQSLLEQIDARALQVEHELALAEKQLAFLDSTLSSLASAELPQVEHLKDFLTLERLVAQAEKTFLVVAMSTLREVRSEGHDPAD